MRREIIGARIRSSVAAGAILVFGSCETSPRPDVAAETGPATRLIEELRIGSVDAGVEAFGLINGLGVGPDGRIVVADLDHGQLQIFASDGGHIRSVGREGEGPGEFAFIQDIAVSDDGDIRVLDVWNGRYSVFDAAGEFKEQLPLVATPGDNLPMRGFVSGDGSFSQISAARGNATGTVVFRIGPDLAISDSVFIPALLDPRVRCLAVPPAAARGRCIRLPVSPRSVWTVDGDGNLWSAARSDVYRIVKQSPSGDTLAVIERAVDPRPVSAGDLDGLRRALADDYPDLGAAITLSPSHLPDMWPYFDLLWAGRDGSLWVRRSDTRFDVYDAGGTFLEEVASPVALAEPYVITPTHVYGVTYDELDVPYVVRMVSTPAG